MWVDPTLLLDLPLNEGSGTIAYDKSMYKQNGTIDGALWLDSLLYFDEYDYIYFTPKSPLKDALEKCSVIYWLKPTAKGEYGGCMRGGAEALDGAVGFWTGMGEFIGTLRFSPIDVVYIYPSAPTLNEWNLYALTYDGAEVRVYKNNGSLEGEIAHTGAVPALSTDFRVGYIIGGEPCRGYIRKVRFSSRDLSVSEMQAIYAKGP
jgi:hypothetical protein